MAARGGKFLRYALPLALAALLAGAGLYVASLHVARAHGTLGVVENLDAPPADWRVAPAADVDVLVIYTRRSTQLQSDCARVVLTRTNARGEYSVPGWWLAPSWPPRTEVIAELHVSGAAHAPLADRSLLGRYRDYTEILGPPVVNPWTGEIMTDEGPRKWLPTRGCPQAERL